MSQKYPLKTVRGRIRLGIRRVTGCILLSLSSLSSTSATALMNTCNDTRNNSEILETMNSDAEPLFLCGTIKFTVYRKKVHANSAQNHSRISVSLEQWLSARFHYSQVPSVAITTSPTLHTSSERRIVGAEGAIDPP